MKDTDEKNQESELIDKTQQAADDLLREIMELREIMADYKASVIDKEEVAFRIREYNENLRKKGIK